MHNWLHHLHQRKRATNSGLEPYPSPRPGIRFLDGIAYIFGILGPLIAIPQVLKIWVDGDVAGVSLISWIGFSIGSLFWICYGLIHHEKPIYISQTLWFFLQVTIIVGVILHS